MRKLSLKPVIVCPECGCETRVKLTRLGELQSCSGCGARYRTNLKPNALVRFCVRIFLLAALVMAMRAVTSVTFILKWLYVIVVLAVMALLLIAAEVMMNLAALRKENAMRRKRLDEKRVKENEMR